MSATFFNLNFNSSTSTSAREQTSYFRRRTDKNSSDSTQSIISDSIKNLGGTKLDTLAKVNKTVNDLIKIIDGQFVVPVKSRSAQVISTEKPLPTTVEEMVTDIKGALGINVSQLTKMLGISRGSLYNHMKNGVGDIQSDYLRLWRLSNQLQEHYPRALRASKKVLVDGRTLFSLIISSPNEHDDILRIASQIEAKLGHSSIETNNSPSINTTRKLAMLSGKKG